MLVMQSAASIGFKIWGSWIRVQKISIFMGKFPKKNSNYPGNFTKKIDFSRQIS